MTLYLRLKSIYSTSLPSIIDFHSNFERLLSLSKIISVFRCLIHLPLIMLIKFSLGNPYKLFNIYGHCVFLIKQPTKILKIVDIQYYSIIQKPLLSLSLYSPRLGIKCANGQRGKCGKLKNISNIQLFGLFGNVFI